MGTILISGKDKGNGCVPLTLGPEVIRLFSCLTQLSIKFFLFINVKMPTIVGILIFKSRKNTILDLPEPEKIEFLDIYILMSS